MMKTKSLFLLGIASVSIVLSACGGGGGSAGTSPFDPNAGNAPAADLDLSPDKVQLVNTPNSKVTLTVTAIDGQKRALKDVDVVVSVASGSDAVVTQTSTKTNDQGRVTADITVGANRANRSVTIEARSGAIKKSTTLQVTGAVITSTLSAPVISPGASGTIRYRVVDQATNPMFGQVAQVTGPGFSPSTATGSTDVNGEYTYSFQAPSATGQYTVSTLIAGVRSDVIVSVQPASTVPEVPAELNISSASVSANPSVIPVNSTGAQNRTEIRALFLGPNNAPIRNVRVRFDLDGDFNSVGGSFTNQASIVYSDANGIATTAYVPGPRPSPTNGVTIRACYGKTDADLVNGECLRSARTTLTIVNDPLGVTIGTDLLIVVNSANLTFERNFVIQVVDSAGNAKRDVNVSASIDLPWYYKGIWTPGTDGWIKSTTAVCLNEDANRNGVLEGFTEDLDRDNRLEPGKSDVSVLLIDTKTDASGLAKLKLTYPQNYGSWVTTRITVAASGVLGTEGRASYLEDPMRVPVDMVKNKDVEPPFRVSPYGINGSNIEIDGVTRNGCYRSD
ncbi:MAG: hypothetical protein ACKOF9_02515 [Burkholderiales bacterium]